MEQELHWLIIEDINTDATTTEAIDKDVKSILEYGLKSQAIY